MGFPGKCHECGGRLKWTVFAGDIYTACPKLCGQLLLEGFDLPSDSEDPGYAFARSVEGLEPLGRRGVEPFVGSDSSVASKDPNDLPF